jgi:hypothetical protein
MMPILLTIYRPVQPLHNLLVRTRHILVFLKDLGIHIFPQLMIQGIKICSKIKSAQNSSKTDSLRISRPHDPNAT